MCKIFQKAKAKNRFAQKLLSMAVSVLMIMAMVPHTDAVTAEPTSFVTSAYANHWGRSDLRAYLNNGLAANVDSAYGVSDKNFKLDSTADSTNATGYAKQFSDKEYGLVQPFKYSTNVFLGVNNTAMAVYETTDKFWLPSGTCNTGIIISWGAEDISSASQFSQTFENNKRRIIPAPYRCYCKDSFSLLRSPSYSAKTDVLKSWRGDVVINCGVDLNVACAAAFKIDLSSVIFSSAASAASFAAEGGAKKIEINGSSFLAKKRHLICRTTVCI